MPSTYKPILLQRVDEYLAWLESRNRAETTIVDYRYTLEKFYYFLRDSKLETTPDKIGKDEVEAFRRKRESEVGQKYYQTQMRQLKGFFRYIKNPAMDDMYLEFSEPPRPNVTWLNEDEIPELINAIETPLEDLLVHLGLELGLRMIEMRRLRLQDFVASKTINVKGKGRNGGKWRTLPYHKETAGILNKWLAERKKIVEKAQRKYPDMKVPDNLIIYNNRAWKLGTYEKGGLMSVLKRLVRRAGINPQCAFHTLRRTFGRMMYLRGVRIEKIAKLLGHSNTETTLLYIGINLDDMSDALRDGANFR
jgi:integrase/recombinase XerD